MMTFDQNTYTIFLKNSDPSINFMPIFKSTGFCMTVSSNNCVVVKNDLLPPSYNLVNMIHKFIFPCGATTGGVAN